MQKDGHGITRDGSPPVKKKISNLGNLRRKRRGGDPPRAEEFVTMQQKKGKRVKRERDYIPRGNETFPMRVMGQGREPPPRRLPVKGVET